MIHQSPTPTLLPPVARADRRQLSRAGAAATRRGAAATELAMCLPLLALLLFGSIQACDMIYLKHGATAAAYEGSLELAKRSATNDTVIARTRQLLAVRGVNGAAVRILPAGSDVATSPRGTRLTVEVAAPVRSNLSLSGFFRLPADVTAVVVGTR